MCSPVQSADVVERLDRSSPGTGAHRGDRRAAPARAGAAAAAGAAGPGRRGCGGLPAPPGTSTTFSTSSRVIRPPTPVPVMVDGSSPFSSTRRRTSGDSSVRPRRRRGSGGSGRLGAGGAAGAGAAGGGRCRLRGAGGRSRRGGLGRGCRSGAAPRPGLRRGRGSRVGAPRPGLRLAGLRRRRGRLAGTVAVRHHGEHGSHVDRLALGHPDLAEHADCRWPGPRCRPCRWTPRRAARPR